MEARSWSYAVRSMGGGGYRGCGAVIIGRSGLVKLELMSKVRELTVGFEESADSAMEEAQVGEYVDLAGPVPRLGLAE